MPSKLPSMRWPHCLLITKNPGETIVRGGEEERSKLEGSPLAPNISASTNIYHLVLTILAAGLFPFPLPASPFSSKTLRSLGWGLEASKATSAESDVERAAESTTRAMLAH